MFRLPKVKTYLGIRFAVTHIHRLTLYAKGERIPVESLSHMPPPEDLIEILCHYVQIQCTLPLSAQPHSLLPPRELLHIVSHKALLKDLGFYHRLQSSSHWLGLSVLASIVH